jgi:hypothetical protein
VNLVRLHGYAVDYNLTRVDELPRTSLKNQLIIRGSTSRGNRITASISDLELYRELDNSLRPVDKRGLRRNRRKIELNLAGVLTSVGGRVLVVRPFLAREESFTLSRLNRVSVCGDIGSR